MAKRIIVTLEDLKKHLGHEDKIRLDHGRGTLRGEKPIYEYSMWCDDCMETIGTTIKVKE